MSSSGSKAVVVYHGDVYLGELEASIIPSTPDNNNNNNIDFPNNNEIRIHRLSPQSERCPPLSVLHTISSTLLCKLHPSSLEHPNLITLHATCFHEFKTAVVLVGEEEIHLVAMPSKHKKFPCFWCFSVPSGLYDSCLGLLNMRCLSIVFDLDETLIVANTMKSFEDRIDTLRGWIARETDPLRISGMSAEMKRYMDDRLLLKQYIDGDSVMDNGKMYKVQMEDVPVFSDSHESVVRPVIRLQERNIVLTRINPEIRDTSVLVRLRPAWEDLRSYLTAKGRKRFEVYVCTMAERDYALEMWRLLDPEANLISSKQLLNRVVCVKAGSRKSLLNVFKDGMCHPKMAMVIDDRSKVWEDKDQPRVHVVPPFTPYYAPQAETAYAVPVLCVARNVACNVRGYFFKEFDENLIRRISEVFYEDEVVSLPSAPDVSDYMMSEEAGYAPNGNGNAPPFSEGMSGAEVEQRLSQSEDKSVMDSTTNSMSSYVQPSVVITPSVSEPTSSAFMPSQKPSLLGAPVRRDLRNQNSGQPPLLSRVPAQIPSSVPSGLISHQAQSKGEEVLAGRDMATQSLPSGSQSSDISGRTSVYSSSRENQNEAAKFNPLSPPHLSIAVMQEIGRRCSSKVEFKTVVSTSKDLQFSVEVLFSGEKIGFGTGKTRKDAQQQAAENALHSLAEKYVASARTPSRAVDWDSEKLRTGNENGFLWDVVSPGSSEAAQDERAPKAPTPEGVKAEPGSASVSANQQPQKRASSPP